MTLRDTLPRNVGARWRVQLEWTATQDTSANSSTVTAKIYWISLDRYGAVYASATNPVSITINGNKKTGSATSQLNANQKKLLLTHTVTIAHDSDGKKNFTISGSYNVNVKLDGNWYYNQTVSDSYDLTTIPRESSLSGDANWTAGKNRISTVSRASSKFNHEVKYYVKNTSNSWVLIKVVHYNTSTTSKTSGFSTAENQLIFQTLNQRSSANCRIVVDTFNGSTFVGGTAKDGTINTPEASFPYSNSSFNIGSTFRAEAKYYLKEFNHTIRLKNGSTVLKSYTGISSANTPTADAYTDFVTGDIKNTILQLIPNSESINLTLEVITYYGSVQVRSARSKTIVAKASGDGPIFNANLTYHDAAINVRALTGNDQYIVSESSYVMATFLVAERAIAQNGASMVKYVATLGGVTRELAYSTTNQLIFEFGKIQPKVDQTLVVQAVDSRGNSTMVSKTVKVLPYYKPAVSVKAARLNGFEDETDIYITGTVSRLTVDGVAKNEVTSVKYRYKLVSSTAWNTFTTITPDGFSGFPNFVVPKIRILLDRLKNYHLEIVVTDKLGSSSVTRTITSGRPIMHIDEFLNSVGFGDFPETSNQIFINMGVKFGANNYASTGGGLDMNNSDIVGANGIYFNDVSGNSGEGLLFAKTGVPEKSTNRADYDNFYIADGKIYMNNHLFAQIHKGNSTGNGLSVGAGGRTAVGGGEAAENLLEYLNDNSIEELHLVSDNNVYVETDIQNGVAGRKTWRFDEDGIFYRPRYKEGNGYNTTTVRSLPNTDDPMLIQNVQVAVDVVGGSSFVDVVFPVVFSDTAQWVLGIAVNANSFSTNVAIYNITNSGCRVYARHVDFSQTTYTTYVQVVACGRRS